MPFVPHQQPAVAVRPAGRPPHHEPPASRRIRRPSPRGGRSRPLRRGARSRNPRAAGWSRGPPLSNPRLPMRVRPTASPLPGRGEGTVEGRRGRAQPPAPRPPLGPADPRGGDPRRRAGSRQPGSATASRADPPRAAGRSRLAAIPRDPHPDRPVAPLRPERAAPPGGRG